jgi:hypothetical protein
MLIDDDGDIPTFACPHPRLGNRYQRTVSLHSYSFAFFFRDNFKPHVNPLTLYRAIRLSVHLSAVRRDDVDIEGADGRNWADASPPLRHSLPPEAVRECFRPAPRHSRRRGRFAGRVAGVPARAEGYRGQPSNCRLRF